MSDEQKEKLVPISTGQCIWVDAGVISYRLCTLNYQCERCSLHQALMDGPQLIRPVDKSIIPQNMEHRRGELKELFDKLPADARKCRYMLTGDVSYKLCINSFKCASCSFAQMMEDSIESDRDTFDDKDFVKGGIRLSVSKHYHRGHVWVHVERDGNIRVGLDDFSQALLGPVEGVRIPGPGDSFQEGVSVCELQLGHGTISIPTPVSGRIISSNSDLVSQPALINDYPYTRGWLYTLKPSDLAFELKSLLYGHDARCWFEAEIERAKEWVASRAPDVQRSEMEVGEQTAWVRACDCAMAREFLLAETKQAA